MSKQRIRATESRITNFGKTTQQLVDLLGTYRVKDMSPLLKGILLSLFIVGAAGGLYYFGVQGKREARFEQNRFRSLAALTEILVDSYVELGRLQDKEFDKLQPIKISIAQAVDTADLNEYTDRAIPLGFDEEHVKFLAYEKLIQTIAHDQLFDHLLLAHDKEIVYQNLANGVPDKFLTKIDSITRKKITIGAETYEVFSHHFDFSDVILKRMAEQVVTDQPIVQKWLIEQLEGRWKLIGFVSEETVYRQVNKVDIWVAVTVVILAFVLLVSLPLLKLILIRKVELVRATDALLTIFSLIIGGPLLVIVFLGLAEYGDYSKSEAVKELKRHSQAMNTAFCSELTQVIAQLNEMEQAVVEDATGAPAYDLKLGMDVGSKHFPATKYPIYNEMVLIPSKSKDSVRIGRPMILFSPLEKLTSTDLQDRTYFQKAKEQNLWKFGSHQIYLQSLTSRFSGKQEAVISMAGKNKLTVDGKEISYVKAISATLGSVFHTILPFPYQFAMIDETGEVLFHSEQARNNNENFLDEINPREKGKLLTYMELRKEDVFTSSYWGTRIHGNIRPVKGTPLFLITYYEMESSRLFISEIMGNTLLFFMLSVILLLLAMVLLFLLVKRKRRFVKIQSYVFDWIRPKEINTYQYAMLCCLFLGYACWMIYQLYNLDNSFPQFYTMILITPCASFLVCYFVLSRFGLWYPEVLLFIMTCTAYYLTAQLEPLREDIYWRIWLWFPFLLMLLYQWCRRRYDQPNSGLFYLMVSTLAVFGELLAYRCRRGYDALYEVFWRRWKPHMKEETATVATEKAVSKLVVPYKAFISLWFISCFLLPTALLFIKVNFEENVLWTRYALVRTALDFQEKMKTIYDFHRDEHGEFQMFERNTIEVKSFLRKKIDKGNYAFKQGWPIKSMVKSKGDLLSGDRYDPVKAKKLRERQKFRSIFNKKSHYLSNLLTDQQLNQSTGSIEAGLYFGDVRDTVRNDLVKGKCKEVKETINTMYLSDPDAMDEQYRRYAITQKVETGFVDHKHVRYAIFILGICFLAGYVYIIHFVVNALFGFKYRHVQVEEHFDIKSCFKDREKMVFLIVTPGLTLDLDTDLYTVREIHLGAKKAEVEALLTELDLLQAIPKPVVFKSAYYPSILLDHYMEEFAEPEEVWVVQQYVRLFSSMPQHIVGYQFNNAGNSNNDFINCNLAKFDDTLLKISDELQLVANEGLAHSHYLQIWHTLTDREKYAMYDLAVDGFFNAKNSRVLSSLIKKGLVRWKKEEENNHRVTEGLSVMHFSFRNFVLNLVAKDYGKKLKAEIGHRSTWTSLSTVIYVILAAAILFVAISEPDFFSDFNAFISLVAGILTIVPTFGSLMESGER